MLYIVPLQVSTDVVYYYSLVKKVQKRIIAIIQHLPERSKKQTVLTQKELRPKLDDLMNESKHVLVRHDGRIHCKVCLSGFSESDPLLKSWMSSACTVEHTTLASHNRPVPIYDNFIHIGNQFVHHTHKLNVYRGLIYCGKCGYRQGTNQIRNLAKTCEPGAGGARNLEAIQDGRLPHGLDRWPDQDDDDGSSCESHLSFY